MENRDKEEKPEVQFRKKYLTTHAKGRKYLNQVINEFRADPKPDVSKYRALAYLLKVMLDYFSFERDILIEERLESLESKLNEIRGDQGAADAQA